MKNRKGANCVFFKVNSTNDAVVVDEELTKSASSQQSKDNNSEDEAKQQYKKFADSLPTGECRYAVYNFVFFAKDGTVRDKVLFYYWAPDGVKIREKMIYSSSTAALKNKLSGIQKDIQATDADEASYETVYETVQRIVK